MDPMIVAAIAGPFVVNAAQALGEKVWDRASEAAADEAVGIGQRVLRRLMRQHGDSAPELAQASGLPLPRQEIALREAISDLAVTPQDPDIQAALRVAVRRMLVADPELAQDIASLLPAGQTQQAGDGTVQVGGDIVNSVISKGDNNRISYRGPGTR